MYSKDKWKLKQKYTFSLNCPIFFFLKFLEDMSPFCGATDTPILDFWWRLLWVSKPDWVLPYSSLAEAYVLQLSDLFNALFTSGPSIAWKVNQQNILEK